MFLKNFKMSSTEAEYESDRGTLSMYSLDTDIEESDMDHDDFFGNDITKNSFMRGKSVKEFDEQLSHLQKENFNLKLRIYFLEERMGTAYRAEDNIKVIKKNIELNTEIEELRRELEEKHDLLCQAVKAIELRDEEHKKEMAKKDLIYSDLMDKVEALQHEIEALSEVNSVLQKQESVDEKIINGDLHKEVDQLNHHIEDLEQQLALEREHSEVLEEKSQETECLELRCKNFEKELSQKDTKLEKLVIELEGNKNILSTYNIRLRTLEDKLEVKSKEVELRDQELNKQSLVIKEQNCEIKDLKNAITIRESSITDLDGKLTKCKNIIKTLEAKIDSIAHENKKNEEKLEAIKEQRRRSAEGDIPSRSYLPENSNSKIALASPSITSTITHRSDSDNFETMSSLKEELMKKELKISELDREYKKSLGVIKSLISRMKNLESILTETKTNFEKTESQLKDLQIKYMKSTLYETFGEKSSADSKYDSDRIQAMDKENVSNNVGDLNVLENMNKTENMTLEFDKQIQKTLKKKEEMLTALESQCETLSLNLNSKDNRINELEKEIEDLKETVSQVNKLLNELKTEKCDMNISSCMEEKDKKIVQLENDVRKHTSNLQIIVNNELWEKNREIERLQNRFTEKINALEKGITSKDMHLKKLKDEIAELGVHVNLPSSLILPNDLNQHQSLEIPRELITIENQLKISTEECKYLHKTVDDLRQQLRNTPERDTNSTIAQLKIEIQQVRQDCEKSEKCKLQMVNLCSLLMNRLDELAHFLDSLLKHKSVLGVLEIKQRCAIKQAIDQSLDLSKSFSISLMNDENSLAQLSSISGILNMTQNSENISLFETLDENADDGDLANVSLTYNSHLSQKKDKVVHTKSIETQQAEIINVLRTQIETLKKEIEVRDTELCKQTLDSHISSGPEKSLENDKELLDMLFDIQSNSKMLTPEILSPHRIYKNLTGDKGAINMDNLSESESWSEPDRDVSQARIGLDALKSPVSLVRSRFNKSGSVKDLTSSTDDDDNDDDDVPSSKQSSKRNSLDNRKSQSTMQEHLSILENKLKEKDNEILTLHCSLMDLDNKMKSAKINVCEDVERLKNEKAEIEKNYNFQIRKFQEIIEEAKMKLEETIKNNDEAFKQAEIKIADLQQNAEVAEEYMKEKEKDYFQKLTENENKWFAKTLLIEQETERKVKEITDEMNNLKKKYDNEYIPKSEMLKHFTEMNNIQVEVESLKDVLKTAESRVNMMEDSERQLKGKLLDSERTSRDKLTSLKRELNETTLRASQAVLERTKACNEKLRLEQEVRKLEMRENEKHKELILKDKQLLTLKNTLQKQLSTVECQKSNLQLKLSELETTNAELHNRLIKIQNGSTDTWPKSTPTSPIKITEIFTNIRNYGKHSLGGRFSRQRSDMSGYVSEDHFTDENDGGMFNRSAPEGCQWFNHIAFNVPVEAVESRNVANSSPDLGIESDQGRFSSLETNVTTTRPLLQTLELTASMSNLLSADNVDNRGLYCNISCHKLLEKENADLQRSISNLEYKLEKTYAKLSIINQTKKQVEKAVCKQIQKTSVVLRQARANLDSGSETEVRK